MRFRFIQKHQDRWPVGVTCRVLKVSRSGFYAWGTRAGSEQAQRRARMTKMIRVVHVESDRTYGSPRVHRELISLGITCSVNFVARLMQDARIAAKTRKKFKITTDSKHNLPVAENLLDRNFSPARINQAWASDITFVSTREGWLYLATVQDLYSRRIVGWAMSNRIDSRLVVDALQMAIDRRNPKTGLIVHSDRGSQYCSDHYQSLLKKYGLRCSMSRKGNCWDNAPMESFFRTLKVEHVYWHDYATRDEAHRSITQFIELFYNRRRRHSTLNYVSPVEYEVAA